VSDRDLQPPDAADGTTVAAAQRAGVACPPVPGTGAEPVVDVAPVPVRGTLPVLSDRLLLRSPPATSPPGGTARSSWLVLPLFSGEEAASWARAGPTAKVTAGREGENGLAQRQHSFARAGFRGWGNGHEDGRRIN
jgi:hypothetical protein